MKKGDLKGVRTTIKDMREKGFPEQFMQYFEARIQVAEGKWRQASYLLERLRPNVTGWPEFLVQVDLFLGACYEQLRLPDRQLSTYQELLDRDPSLDAARAGYASALFRTGKFDEATKEYERLVGKKVAARVTGSGGASCTLRHPENRSIELEIRKDEFRLDPAGAIPSCEALQAMVECEGKAKPESSPES